MKSYFVKNVAAHEIDIFIQLLFHSEDTFMSLSHLCRDFCFFNLPRFILVLSFPNLLICNVFHF